MPNTADNIGGFIDSSKKFFNKIGGNIIDLKISNRNNIEIITAEDDNEVDVCSVYVEFNNGNMFGSSNYLDAYKRYRQMRYDWWEHLAKDGYPQWNPKTRIIGNFFPLIKQSPQHKDEYPSEKETSFGCKLTRVSEAGLGHHYYDRIAKDFGINWLLEDGNGIAIGPDVGLLYAVSAAIEVNHHFDTFLDIGAGTGELSVYVLKNSTTRKIILNEVSQALFGHLKNYVGPLASKNGVDIDYAFGDAHQIDIPAQISFLSLGIYYGSQPGFIEKHGKKISKSMGASGVLAVQSGMLEGRFNISSITGDDSRLLDWSWFSRENTLSSCFKYVESVFVADEVITFAANDICALDPIIKKLRNSYRATTVPQMKILTNWQ